MAETVIEGILTLVGLYLLLGFFFAIPFVLRGAAKIDPVAREGTRGFRILIFPGVMVFWPLLLKRWRAGLTEPPAECNAHRAAAKTFDVPTESSP